MALTAALAAGLAGCGASQAAAPAAAPPLVQVAAVAQRDVPLASEWNASLDGYVNAQIQPHLSGYLTRQDYREGSVVRRGQVLFEIDPRPFQAALDQARAQWAEARAQVAVSQAGLAKAAADVARDTPLAQAQAVPQSQLDNDTQAKAGAAAAVAAAQAAVAAAQAAVEQDRLNLSYTQVTSLIGGIAGSAQGQIGDLVTPATVLTSVSQVNPIKAYFPITEQEYLRTQRGGRAGTPLAGIPLTLVLANGDVYPRRGHVLWAERQLDASTGTIRLAAAFPNPDNILRPGEYGRVRAVTRIERQALLVPQAALTQLQGGYQVAVVEGGKVRLQAVTVGPRVGSDAIITQGLRAGEQVVVAGLPRAQAGASVRVQPAPPAGRR
ncbi:MAG TPA: efflux RND transporter periplasmic adaptor subunit [Terriglobales bacterium]|nr:efflux RND transporter periplasmic adaptor subunit [Terriglobales bacterium]